MIVLGPSISPHHLLESNDGGDTDEQNYESTPNSYTEDDVESIPDNCVSMPLVLQEDELQIIGEDLIHLLNDIRIKCSQELGSIGAPLSSSIGNQSTKQLTNTNITTFNDVDVSSTISRGIKTTSQSSVTYQANLNRICNMATTHTNLIQRMNNILETISLGTSLRLGLGPTNEGIGKSSIGSGRLVARVEKNWVARQEQLKQHPQSHECTSNAQSKSNPIAQQQRRQPVRLTLQKIRNILHQTIVDIATSLQETLKHAIESYSQSATTEWDDFVSDLQHSMKSKSNPHILTISQLTIWINNLGTFLSFILSTILDRDGSIVLLVSNSLIMASVKQSVQFANERIAFLHSACPVTRPQDDIMPSHTDTDTLKSNTSTGKNNNASNISRNQKKRQAKQLIQNLQTTLDAARVSLWAFEQSYAEQDDIGDDIVDASSSDQSESNHDTTESDDMAWWSQFKDLMERSQSSIPEFENQFLSTAVDEDAEQESVVEMDNSDLSTARQVATECSELISAAEEKLSPTTTAELESKHPSLPVNKTLVFSGSGTKSLNKKRIVMSTPAEQDSSPPTFNSVDQMRLLQDLQTRIKTIGLAEEHEVVNTDPHAEMIDTEDRVEEEKDKGGAAISSNKGNDKRQGSQSCFLGVSGSLLAELSSTIGKEGIEGDDDEII